MRITHRKHNKKIIKFDLMIFALMIASFFTSINLVNFGVIIFFIIKIFFRIKKYLNFEYDYQDESEYFDFKHEDEYDYRKYDERLR